MQLPFRGDVSFFHPLRSSAKLSFQPGNSPSQRGLARTVRGFGSSLSARNLILPLTLAKSPPIRDLRMTPIFRIPVRLNVTNVSFPRFAAAEIRVKITLRRVICPSEDSVTSNGQTAWCR